MHMCFIILSKYDVGKKGQLQSTGTFSLFQKKKVFILMVKVSLKKKEGKDSRRKNREGSLECLQQMLPWELCFKCEKQHSSCLSLRSPSCVDSCRKCPLISTKF